MESDKITSDALIKELGGCGLFQIVFCTLTYLSHIPEGFSVLFMAFGAYSPGWRCLDTNRSTHNTDNIVINASTLAQHIVGGNGSVIFHNIHEDEIVDAVNDETEALSIGGDFIYTCDGFSECQNVQFNPEASTVVTEWGLLCDKAWPVPLIMSVQMAGSLVGALLLGYMGDKLGRKITLYVNFLMHAAFSLISMFSVSWEMFAALRFLIGISHPVYAFLPVSYMAEFVPVKMRVIVGSIPMWSVGCILFSICAMLTRDWRQIYLIIVLIDIVCFLPVLWVPESLRWLAVNDKTEKYLDTGKMIARLNKTDLNQDHCAAIIKEERSKANSTKQYGILSLFRRGYAKNAMILGFVFVSINILYFMTLLGVGYLPGNFYMKLILATATELPANLIAASAPNLFGRKISASASCVVSAICLIGAIVCNILATGSGAKNIGILAFVSVGKACIVATWYVCVVYIIELYPTVVRTSASGYGGLMNYVGAFVAPYLIPTNTTDEFYRNYSIVAAMLVVSSILLLLLPETKGKPLKDTFETTSPIKEQYDETSAKEIGEFADDGEVRLHLFNQIVANL